MALLNAGPAAALASSSSSSPPPCRAERWSWRSSRWARPAVRCNTSLARHFHLHRRRRHRHHCSSSSSKGKQGTPMRRRPWCSISTARSSRRRSSPRSAPSCAPPTTSRPRIRASRTCVSSRVVTHCLLCLCRCCSGTRRTTHLFVEMPGCRPHPGTRHGGWQWHSNVCPLYVYFVVLEFGVGNTSECMHVRLALILIPSIGTSDLSAPGPNRIFGG